MFVFIACLRRFATIDPVLVKKDSDLMAKACLYSDFISEPFLVAKYVYIVHVSKFKISKLLNFKNSNLTSNLYKEKNTKINGLGSTHCE